MRERTILVGGFSKDYAMTGWRIGYVCAPREILDGMARIHQYVIMTAPTMAQYGALEGLTSCEDFVQNMVQEYNRRRKLVVKVSITSGCRPSNRTALFTPSRKWTSPAWTTRPSQSGC
jgi:aspartate/methionine/tyrosine aminotransferase